MVIKKARREVWQEHISKALLISGTQTLQKTIGKIIEKEHECLWDKEEGILRSKRNSNKIWKRGTVRRIKGKELKVTHMEKIPKFTHYALVYQTEDKMFITGLAPQKIQEIKKKKNKPKTIYNLNLK